MLKLLDLKPARESFLEHAIEGLSGKPKRLSPKFLYDERGSELFERICKLPEYYVTRTEMEILRNHASDLGAILDGPCTLFEFGSGASLKTRVLLDQLRRSPCTYVPIDISRDALWGACREIQARYPRLKMLPVCADFTQPLSRLRRRRGFGGTSCTRVAFFPGSTLGNFHPEEAHRFLRDLAAFLASSRGARGYLILGLDLIKDRSVLEAAYDDSRGVTAAFNLNLLRRMNQELGTNFVVERFRHRAWFNPLKKRIEMHLVSLEPQSVLLAGRRFSFHAGESIHTENSYKYDVEDFSLLAQASGFEPVKVWTDPKRYFSVWVLRAGLRATHLGRELDQAA